MALSGLEAEGMPVMKVESPASQAIVVIRKELRDWSRDRRSIITVLISSLLAPGLIFFLFNSMANRQRQVEDVTIPVVGAANAPALVDWLRQQAGITSPMARPMPKKPSARGAKTWSSSFPRTSRRTSAPRSRRRSASSPTARARTRGRRCSACAGLLQRYNAEIGSLRLIARGISPAVATAVQIEDVEVSSSQQRAAQILGFIPLFVMISAFTGAMAISTDSTAGERERGSFEALLVNPAPRMAIAAASGWPAR